MHKLGDLNSSEALIKDLFVDLRKKTWKWAAITHQTNQAKMGYIAQHLVSIVTGYKGSKSGARGKDLKIDEGSGEIKVSVQVDQLGQCKKKDCKARVASWEETCSECGSAEIVRKEDSKWLLKPHKEEYLKELFAEKWIYLTLFSHEDIKDPKSPITITICRINPRHPGFVRAIADWHLYDYPRSKTAIDLHPGGPKFHFANPEKIYESKVTFDGDITTTIFPGVNEPVPVKFPPNMWISPTSILPEMLEEFCANEGIEHARLAVSKTAVAKKREYVSVIEKWSTDEEISESKLVEKLSDIFYLSLHEKPVRKKKTMLSDEDIQKYENYLPD
jgi:hypothetical protein